MIRFVLALAALLVIAPAAAQAASFDCGKAATSFEKAICSDPEISTADEVLAQAYATSLGGLSEAAASEVKSAQKSWLSYAERLCSDDAQPIPTDYTDDQKQCLASTFRTRIRGLEASRMQGGYRFYPIHRFLVEPDTEAEPDAYVKVADKQFQIVKIDSTSEIATAFNAAIDQAIADQGSFFNPGTTDIAAGDVTSDYDLSTRVSLVTTERISLETNEYWSGHGAAHGNYTITNRHFLLGEKRMLDASDIFSGEGWQKTLAGLALEKLKALLGEDGLFDPDPADLEKWVADPLRWDFSEQGLEIRFQIYEVTAYAAGAPVVTIGWSEIEGLLSDRAEEIATYGIPY